MVTVIPRTERSEGAVNVVDYESHRDLPEIGVLLGVSGWNSEHAGWNNPLSS